MVVVAAVVLAAVGAGVGFDETVVMVVGSPREEIMKADWACKC